MLDIKDIKTSDLKILNKTIVEMTGVSSGSWPISNLNVLFECVEKLPCQTNIFFDRDLGRWVFTDIYDEYLVSQEFFQRENFVVVENSINIALARGIHYRYHKKLRE